LRDSNVSITSRLTGIARVLGYSKEKMIGVLAGPLHEHATLLAHTWEVFVLLKRITSERNSSIVR